jgi:hypothetical protein
MTPSPFSCAFSIASAKPADFRKRTDRLESIITQYGDAMQQKIKKYPFVGSSGKRKSLCLKDKGFFVREVVKV